MTQAKLRVGVIFGSRSCEYDISLNSATAVLANLDRNKYEVIPLGITREGVWLLGVEPGELRTLEEKANEHESIQQNRTVLLAGDPNLHGLLALENGKPVGTVPLDVVIPMLHGPYGEDGTIQGFLEMADIPYVGCGVLGSAIGMDKEKMKMIFQTINLPVIDSLVYRRSQWEHSPETVLMAVEQQLGYPCVVKPVNMGSSVGVGKAKDRETLVQAITQAAQYDSKVLIERWLNVREISCGVLGNDELATSLIGEYVTEEQTFLDYNAKYIHVPFHFDVPADIPQTLAESLFQMSKQAFLALDLSGLARVDFFLDRNDQRIYINEVNTMPGFSQASVYPKLWNASGLPYPQLLDRLIELALERHQDRKRTLTR